MTTATVRAGRNITMLGAHGVKPPGVRFCADAASAVHEIGKAPPR